MSASVRPPIARGLPAVTPVRRWDRPACWPRTVRAAVVARREVNLNLDTFARIAEPSRADVVRALR